MKVNQMDTTKEGAKAFLETAAEKLGCEWHAQAAHKAAVGIFFMDMLGIDEQSERDAVMRQWLATPASFGANASALGQQLGRESAKAKLEKTFSGF